MDAARVFGVHSHPSRERAGAGRQGLVWQVLEDALSTISGAELPAVLDCGGGSGSFAVPLAQAGAQVTVVDVSADALATLRRRAAEAGVQARVRAVQGDIEALGDLVAPASFDLVLAHGIVESVDDVGAAFAAIAGTVRAGGLLSVLIGNPVAGVLARALSGDVAGALAELRGLDVAPPRPGPAAVQALCRSHGFELEQLHGVGVFSELVPGASLDAPGARAALAELELEAGERRLFADIASRVHLLARR